MRGIQGETPLFFFTGRQGLGAIALLINRRQNRMPYTKLASLVRQVLDRNGVLAVKGLPLAIIFPYLSTQPHY